MNLSSLLLNSEDFNIQTAQFRRADNSNVSSSAGAWRVLTLNVEGPNDIDGCVKSGDQITLEPGVYHVTILQKFTETLHSRAGLWSVTNSQLAIDGCNTYYSASSSNDIGRGTSAAQGIIEVVSTEVFEIRYITSRTQSGGIANNSSTFDPDVSTDVTFMRLA